HTMKTAPTTAVTGTRRLWHGPTRKRAAWGSTSPTNPIAPAALTRTAVINAVTMRNSRRVRPTAIPRVAAVDEPNVKASSEDAFTRHTTIPAAQTAPQSATSVQVAPLREPSSQNSTPRVRSASAEEMTMNDVSAENSCVPATPASTTREVPPPAPVASSSTSAKETSAPRNAPPDNDTAPPPMPSTAIITAPVEAPEEMPSTKGSASGLRNNDCMITPHTASPAPHTAASKVRGRRSSHTIPSRIAVTELSAKPRRSKITAYTSTTDNSAGPIVTVTAIDSARTISPATTTTPATGARRPFEGRRA